MSTIELPSIDQVNQVAEETTATATALASDADKSLLARAAATAADRKQRESDQEAKWKREQFTRYVEILFRANTPQPGDDEWLAGFMGDPDFGITRERVEGDLVIIRQAKEFKRQHDDRAASATRRLAAAQALRDFDKRTKEDRHRLWMAVGLAETEESEASTAAHELGMLTRRAPYLFDTACEPPRLLCDLSPDAK